MKTGSMDHTLFLCHLGEMQINPLLFVNAGGLWWQAALHQVVGSHLEGHAHGTRDVDAEEQQSFCCERLFVRMEQKQVVVVTGGGLLW